MTSNTEFNSNDPYSIIYQVSNIDDLEAIDFVNQAIMDFYSEVDIHIGRTNRVFNDWHLVEYGEMTMVNLLINGILRNDDTGFYNVLNEFGVENPEDKSLGRADLIVEDIITKNVFYIEAKKWWSNEDAPKSKSWEKEKTEQDYKTILEQAKWYVDKDYKNYKSSIPHNIYAIAMVFDSVKIENKSALSNWINYVPLENEFYAFKTFNHNSKTIGSACYGLVEKLFPKPKN